MKPKLYAVFDKDGNLFQPQWCGSARAFITKGSAWNRLGFTTDGAIRRAKRQGYTCEEVEIVRVKR